MKYVQLYTNKTDALSKHKLGHSEHLNAEEIKAIFAFTSLTRDWDRKKS